MERSFFAESISEVLEKLATDPARGLTTEEANARLGRKGLTN